MKTQIIEVAQIDGSIVEHVIATEDDVNFISMPKSTWDELNADSEGNK